jgi:GT2 family glycosyltransferase
MAPQDATNLESGAPRLVPGNRWTVLPAPLIGDWTPVQRVSLILPHYNRPAELNLTLAAVTEQSYPLGLVEVVVVDDGSTNPPDIDPEVKRVLNLEVVVQERAGFGLARARNLGARVSGGEVIVFLDCDMVPERQHLEAHARWHHVCSEAVTIGARCHVDFTGIGADDISGATAAGETSRLFEDRRVTVPRWIEDYLKQTADLTIGVGQWRVASGGNLGVGRSLFEEVGGLDESFNQWGGEDNEFAFRAGQMGAVFVPERQALAWHQGEGHEPSVEERQSQRLQQPKLENLIADRTFRYSAPGRSFAVPYCLVAIDAEGMAGEEVAVAVDAVLGGSFHDLEVYLHPGESGDDAEWLARRYQSDPRVMVGERDWDRQRPFSPLRVEMPATAKAGSRTMQALADLVDGESVGLLYSTVVGADPSTTRVRAVLTRAVNRVRRYGLDGDLDDAIARLFGQRWVSGADIGIVAQGMEIPMAWSDSAWDNWASQHIAALEEQVRQLENRRALKLVDGLGGMATARSGSEFRAAWKRLRDTPPEEHPIR